MRRRPSKCAATYAAGIMATETLEMLVRGKTVVYEPKTTDRYGRTVAICRADGEDRFVCYAKPRPQPRSRRQRPRRLPSAKELCVTSPSRWCGVRNARQYEERFRRGA
jgi:hypothetical protein